MKIDYIASRETVELIEAMDRDARALMQRENKRFLNELKELDYIVARNNLAYKTYLRAQRILMQL